MYMARGEERWCGMNVGVNILNIARIANAVPVALYSKVTMKLLILLFAIVRNVISVSSQVSGHKSQELLFGGVL